jgi:hypothetical protein
MGANREVARSRRSCAAARPSSGAGKIATTHPDQPARRCDSSTLLAQDSSVSTVARQATAVLVQLYAGRRGDEDSVTASAALTLTDRHRQQYALYRACCQQSAARRRCSWARWAARRYAKAR